METVDELRKRFDHHLGCKPLRAKPQFEDAGLLFGADTLLFAAKAATDTEPQGGTRLLALLQAGYGFPVPAAVVGTVRRAARQWQRGERALAHIHLAFARLPRLADREAAFRLFLADEVLKSGMTPEALIVALDTDGVEKFDPDQPRVPAGSGRESGEWTAGGGGVPVSEPVQTGRSVTTTDFKHACRALKLDPNEASDALHAAKRAAGLVAGDHCTFDLDTGEIFYGGESIGNLGD